MNRTHGSTNPIGAPIVISSKNTVSSLSNVTESTFTVFAGSGFGSGFVISDDGYMITNQHVVKTAKKVTVTNKNGDEFIADVLKTHDARDVALLKIKNYKGAYINVFNTENYFVGEEVYAVGTPRREELSQTVSKGIISAYRNNKGMTFIQSDVQVHPGNSGGPLVTKTGQLVGVTANGYVVSGASQNLNMFIPISDVVKVMNLNEK